MKNQKTLKSSEKKILTETLDINSKYPCHEDFITSDTLVAKLFGVNDVEADAILLLQSLGWTIQLDSEFNVFGLKRKGF